MADKIKELLAVLDLPEEEQKRWVMINIAHLPTAFDNKDKEFVIEPVGGFSLTDLAFRLRDEVKGLNMWMWYKACFIVSEKSSNPAGGRDFTTENGYNAEYDILRGKPIYWIITARIAKELTE